MIMYCCVGRVDLAKILLQQGAIVNTHDYCGWSPLHEACNFGHTEMAHLLLEYGANVNDPGGEHCCGITPLHDAVQNEHYSCVKLLVEFGANPFLRYKNNESSIDLAKEQMSEAEELKCSNERMDKLSNILELLLACRVEDHRPNPLNLNPLHKKRSSVREDSPPPLLPECSSPVKTQSWLVEDMGYRSKRVRMSPRCTSKPAPSRKGLDPYKVLSSPHKTKLTPNRKLGYKQKKHEVKKSCKKVKLDNSNSPIDLTDSNASIDSVSYDSFAFFGANVANTPSAPFLEIPSYQLNHSPSSPDHLSDPPRSAGSVTPRVEVLSIQEVKRAKEVHSVQEVKRVKVTIENDQIKIPCQTNRTIQWLSDEASKRYSSLRGIKPLLQLTDRDGALLMPMDLISEVLSNEEEIIGRVESWDLPSLRDRYKQYCATHGVNLYERLLALLPDLAIENELNLSNKMIPPTELGHLFRCISAQGHLTKLDLSSNMIGDDTVRKLGNSLCNLYTLQSLVLSCCNISCKGITAVLTQLVTQQSTKKPLQSLVHLDLSFNFICGDGGRVLSQFITHTPNLIVLKLESCGLENCSEFSLLSQSICQLHALEELSLIFNKLTECNTNILLRSLSSRVTLNLSHSNADS